MLLTHKRITYFVLHLPLPSITWILPLCFCFLNSPEIYMIRSVEPEVLWNYVRKYLECRLLHYPNWIFFLWCSKRGWPRVLNPLNWTALTCYYVHLVQEEKHFLLRSKGKEGTKARSIFPNICASFSDCNLWLWGPILTEPNPLTRFLDILVYRIKNYFTRSFCF